MVWGGTHGSNTDSPVGEELPGTALDAGEGDANFRELLTRQRPISLAGICANFSGQLHSSKRFEVRGGSRLSNILHV